MCCNLSWYCNDLRVIVRSLLGIAVPTQIATHDSDFAKNEDGTYYVPSSFLAKSESCVAI
jgi:NAD(P)H-dependent FMN reductase